MNIAERIKESPCLLFKILFLKLTFKFYFFDRNIATFFEEIREYLYFNLDGFPELIGCFTYYLEKPKSHDADHMMRMSFTKFDKSSNSE